MAAFQKYHAFIDEVSKGGHNLQTAVYKCALTNTAPNVASHAVWNVTNAPPPAAANGYPAGGNTMTTTSAVTTTGQFKLILADTVFTATAGGIGPFQYVIVYNSTQGNKVVGWYAYTSALTLAEADTFTVDADPAAGILTLE